MLLGLPIQAQGAPDHRLLLFVNVVAVASLLVFGTGAVYIIQRRSFQRRLAEEKLVAVGSAMARILHQIKNPLQTVMLQAELLQDPAIAENPQARNESTQAVLAEAERLAAMLAELSLWVSGSRRPRVMQPVALHVLLRQLAESSRRELKQSGIELRIVSLAEVLVLGDAFALRQAFENLLRNAREAVAEQPQGEVRLALEQRGALALVRVADNGPGIVPDPDIFQPFVSTKPGGMGLGLSICKEIVEAHGGRVEVESRTGAGAEFRVILPLRNAARIERENAAVLPEGA